MEDIAIKYNEQNIYCHNYIYIWFGFLNRLLSLHRHNGYKMIYGDKLPHVIYEKNDIVNGIRFESISYFEDALSARTEALRLVAEFEHLVEDYFGISLLTSNNCCDETKFMCSLIDADNQILDVLQVSLLKEEKICVVAKYNSDIVLGINSYFDRFNLINPFISEYKFGGIVLAKGSAEVKRIVNELNKRYHIFWEDNNLTIKEQYAKLKQRGICYIFEVKNHGRLFVRTISTNESIELDLNLIESYIKETDKTLIEMLKKESIKKLINFNQSNTYYYCDDCINKINEIEFMRPFNQRIGNKKCCDCANKASNKLIKKIN